MASERRAKWERSYAQVIQAEAVGLPGKLALVWAGPSGRQGNALSAPLHDDDVATLVRTLTRAVGAARMQALVAAGG